MLLMVGGEANVVEALYNYSLQGTFVSKVPENAIFWRNNTEANIGKSYSIEVGGIWLKR